MKLYRSLLFVPADNARRVDKALNSDADVAILDLEDAVAISKKDFARRELKTLLSGTRKSLAYVRVNSMDTPFCLDDLHAAVEAGADGVSLPKVESVEEVFAVDWILTNCERRSGREIGSVELLPVIESGKGLLNAQESLRGVRRLRRAGLGVGDLALELGLELSPDQREALPYRQALVLASNAAGLESPLDTVYLDLNNLAGLERSCIESKNMGFQGRRIIHPNHIQIVNKAYSPSVEVIARAEKTVADFDAAEKDGLASLRSGDVFVDYPIAYKAKKILKMRDAIVAASVPKSTKGQP